MRKKKLISMKECTDRMWSENAKCRAGHECAFTEAKEGLNTHHLLGKKTLALRYSHDNAIVISCGMHKFVFHSTSFGPDALKRGIEYNGTTLEHLQGLRDRPEKIPLVRYYEKERDEFLEHMRANRVRLTPWTRACWDFIEARVEA